MHLPYYHQWVIHEPPSPTNAPTCFELFHRLFLIHHAYELNGDAARLLYHHISKQAFVRRENARNSNGNDM